MKKLNAKKILKLWKKAWEVDEVSLPDGTKVTYSNKLNPLGSAVEALLTKEKVSVWDIRTMLGAISAKQSKKGSRLSKDEIALLNFHHRTLYVREQSLTELAALSPAGQIFLLKTQFGYVETQKVEQNNSGKQTVVLEFGQD